MTDYREPLTDEEVERMERGLRRLLKTPPQPHGKNPVTPAPKKSRPAKKELSRQPKSRS
jgi:hypothetical protein